MRPTAELHKRAMQLVDRAMVARAQGDRTGADELMREAYQVERQAAHTLMPHSDLEPSRAVLFRSAASLALECGEVRDAERLIATALSGDPAEEVVQELRDLLEQVYFQRHLDLRGIVLQPAEFQVAIAGPAVGFGVAQSEEFVGRIRDVQTMVYRTAERKLGRAYREGGRRTDALQSEVELYLSAPRAASFAITCRIGSRQMALPGMDIVRDVVDEVIDCLDLFSAGRIEPLRQRIADPAYYRNFVGLARKISPDGDAVRSVGITTLKSDGERRTILTTPRKKTPSPTTADADRPAAQQRERIEVSGVLKFSNSLAERRGLIKILDGKGQVHRVVVPPGMMRDIVRPMYEDEVVVIGRRRRNGDLNLESIDPAQ